jgi:hypothetical protein
MYSDRMRNGQNNRTDLALLYFYVPESHLETVKRALFDAGAGRWGQYRDCAWQCRGTGQFLPEEGSRPFTGHAGKLERLTEYKVEMICPRNIIASVVRRLLEAHPYEEPAYGITAILTEKDL